jgi:tripartite-type tricarboxylate transporter receptor subunit TctC
MELAKNNDSRYLISVLELSNVVSRPFLAPPMIPENQAKKLRDAFAKIVIDEEYIKEAEKIAIDVSPIDWKQTQSIIEQLSAVDKNILKQILN